MTAALAAVLAATPAAALATALATALTAALAVALATVALKLQGASGELLGASGASEELQMSFRDRLGSF